MGKAGRLANAANIGIVLALLGTVATANAQAIPGALPDATKALAGGEWPAYAGSYASARYSPLTQIDRDQRQEPACGVALEVAGPGDQGRQSEGRAEPRQ